MIASGVKKEEYRNIKEYWIKRLTSDGFVRVYETNFKDFDIVQFRNGYAKYAPTMRVECKGIMLRKPRPEWSDNAKGQHFVIKLGKILNEET